MTLLGWVISGALVLIAIFAVANWPLLTATASLNFLLFSVQGPFGLILFGAIVVFAALFAVYALSLRASALLETRRLLKDVAAQREIADNAEASRLAALNAQVTQEFERLRATLQETRAELLRRSDSLEQELRTHVDETANSIFANIGQVDDKLNRLGARPPA